MLRNHGQSFHAFLRFQQLRGGRIASGAGGGTGAGQDTAPGGFGDSECDGLVSHWIKLLNAIVVPGRLQPLFVDHPFVRKCQLVKDVLIVAETHCVKRLLDTVDKLDRNIVTAEVRP